MDDPTFARFRQQARELIGAEQAPCGKHKIYAGFGRGDACSLCGRPIASGDVEYEADVDMKGGSLHTLHFHLACAAIWQSECDRASSQYHDHEPARR